MFSTRGSRSLIVLLYIGCIALATVLVCMWIGCGLATTLIATLNLSVLAWIVLGYVIGD